MADIDTTKITIIGHPWAPIGMGEQLRSHVRAALALKLDVQVYDIFRYAQRSDLSHAALLDRIETATVPGGIRIFHINGDEVERVLDVFAQRGNDFAAGINIIMPAWELPTYPAAWVPALQRFDEIWAISSFVQQSLTAAGLPSHLVGQSVQFDAVPMLPRRHFGIRESAFVLLHFFDISSYAARKNPEAVQSLFDMLRAENPFADLQLVLKVKEGQNPGHWNTDGISDPQIKIIDTPLDTQSVLSLINACDCFVSLHRAEGFGRGLGEAMALGRLALGTGWSGNTDFMTETNALPVRHSSIKLKPDEYPHAKGQHWAAPDLDHAASLLRPILVDPTRGAARARLGQREVLQSHGDRAVGLRMLARLEALLEGKTSKPSRPKKTSTPSTARRR